MFPGSDTTKQSYILSKELAKVYVDVSRQERDGFTDTLMRVAVRYTRCIHWPFGAARSIDAEYLGLGRLSQPRFFKPEITKAFSPND